MHVKPVKPPVRFNRKHSQLLSTAIGVALTCSTFDGAIAQESEVIEEVVVTGSRIVRRDYESTSPIVTIGSETFENRSNIGLEAALNQMPQFTPAGTQSQRSAAGTPFPSATAAPGASTINLRGLGTNRSLVLVDGKRVQPVNASLVVDLNTIPSAAIESVEVITGGAAAVYGADAISGVVNLKLKKDFEGADFEIHYGVTEEGDGEELQLSSLIGADFADGKGNVMLGFNYANREIILSKDREFVRDGWDDPGTDSGGLGTSNLTVYNPVSDNAPTIGFTPVSAYTIDQNGNVFDEDNPLDLTNPYTGPLGGSSGYKINPDGSLAYIDKDLSFLQVPLERYSFFGSANFDLTENTSFFMDLRYSETEAEANGNIVQFNNIWGIEIPYDPLYDDPDSPQFGQAPTGVAQHPVPAELADLLNSRPTNDAPWQYEGNTDYLPPYQTITTSNVFQVSGGLKGEFGFEFADDWTWEAYVSHGKSTVNAQQPEGFTHLPRSEEIFLSDQYGKGFSTSYPISVTGTCESGLPIFNEDGSVNDTPSVTKDCADYMVLRMNSITTLEQNVFEANMQGSLFELPAGILQFAAGASYREEDFKFDPDTGYNANQSYPNVVGNIALPVAVQGNTDVTELYAEFAIPILSDLPFIQSLSLDPGYRISDYNTAGKEETFKFMADWVVNDSVRFRGGIQQANRAPNIAELFTPKGSSTITGLAGTAAPDTCGSWVEGPDWGNKAENPNRLNLQILCQELMVRDGAPPSLYVPGGSADDWKYNVFGAEGYFPYDLAVTAGNPDLESETADTVTAGVVIDSPFDIPALQDLRLSIDYYKIEIEGAIGIPEHNTVYQQCMDAQYNSLIGDAPGSHTGAELAAGSPFCGLIQREYLGDGINDFGADRKFKAAYINQGSIFSEGIDVQVDWATELADIGIDAIPGRFSMNLQVSFLDQYSVAPFPGAEVVDYTGTTVNSSFDYQMFTTFNYSTGPYSVGLRWLHLPELNAQPGSASDIQGVSSYNQFDLFGRWAVSDRYQLRAGIDNLTYAKPEVLGASSTDNNKGSSLSNHDTIGRRFYLAAKISF